LEVARRHLTDGIALCRQFTFTPPLASGLATLAWVRQASGDAGGALVAMAEAERAAPRPAVAGLLNPVPAQHARLLLAQGDLAAAARWADERGLAADDEPDYPGELAHLVLARVLLRQDRPGQALALLERMRAVAVAQGRAGSVIEIQALQALALAASRDDAGAAAILTEALTRASAEGYVRVFADEGAPMAALLGRLDAAGQDTVARRVPAAYLARLLRALDRPQPAPAHGSAAATAVPGLPEPLTARELDVLRLLAAGRSNQRIAHELVVTLDTVKKHVSHVLGKLSAANRTEAVTKARQLGLIP
jgi:LuxR family maltose regulon positive regulatory protein